MASRNIAPPREPAFRLSSGRRQRSHIFPYQGQYQEGQDSAPAPVKQDDTKK